MKTWTGRGPEARETVDGLALRAIDYTRAAASCRMWAAIRPDTAAGLIRAAGRYEAVAAALAHQEFGRAAPTHAGRPSFIALPGAGGAFRADGSANR